MGFDMRIGPTQLSLNAFVIASQSRGEGPPSHATLDGFIEMPLSAQPKLTDPVVVTTRMLLPHSVVCDF